VFALYCVWSLALFLRNMSLHSTSRLLFLCRSVYEEAGGGCLLGKQGSHWIVMWVVALNDVGLRVRAGVEGGCAYGAVGFANL